MGLYVKNLAAVRSLNYHLVGCPKYRRPVLLAPVDRRLQALLPSPRPARHTTAPAWHATSHRLGRPELLGWFPIGQRLQHASCTGAQQIRYKAGQLNVSFFQQTLQAVL